MQSTRIKGYSNGMLKMHRLEDNRTSQHNSRGKDFRLVLADIKQSRSVVQGISLSNCFLNDITIPPEPAEDTRLLAHGIRSRAGHTIPTTAEADGASGQEQQNERHKCKPEAWRSVGI